MPRLTGQIDLAKTEAILDAAAELFGERGLSASMDLIARRAGVSKQTVYNRYGSKAELMRAIVDRRVAEIVAPLLVPGADEHPEEALAAFGRGMIEAVLKPRGTALTRMTVQGATDLPDLARAFYEAGPATSRRRLAQFLERETSAGRMVVDNPALAAEDFAGMVLGAHQMAHLLGVGRDLDTDEIDAIACEAARRFMMAYGD
ncbi:TetR/AcrR family transcriptional regulator [Phenylobacterium sp.]|uniref:TetR/AcrR family transcriptional regulator n=1 Tax=Phenylobacterium sp. TaxID=1871053 RepID=UPI00286C6A28|nr:TetR/AcrR family transcriptional regulator [Phenylobacterium sp.]